MRVSDFYKSNYLIYFLYGLVLSQLFFYFTKGSVHLEYDGSFYLYESLKIKYHFLNGQYTLAFQNFFQTIAGKPFFPLYIFTPFLFIAEDFYTNILIYNVALMCVVVIAIYFLKLDIGLSILAALLIFSNSYFLYYGHSLLFENLSASIFSLLVVLANKFKNHYSVIRAILIAILGSMLLMIKQNMTVYFFVIFVVSVYLSNYTLRSMRYWTLILVIAGSISFNLYSNGFSLMYALVVDLWSGGAAVGKGFGVLYNRLIYLAMFLLSVTPLVPLMLVAFKNKICKNNFYFYVFIFGFTLLFFIDITLDFATRRLNIFIPVIVFWLVSSLNFKRDYLYIIASLLLSFVSLYGYSNYNVLEKYTHIAAVPQPGKKFLPKDLLIEMNIQDGDKILFSTITNTVNPTTLIPFSLNKQGGHKFVVSSPFFTENKDLRSLIDSYNIIIISEKNPFKDPHPFFTKFEIVKSYIQSKYIKSSQVDVNSNIIYIMRKP